MSAASDLVTSVGTVIVLAGSTIAGLRIKRDTAAQTSLKQLQRENADLRDDVVALVEYLYARRVELAAQGVKLAEPPKLKSQRGRAVREAVE